jgi:RimJ/RimL family protein N-acetyltransferase
MINGKTIKLKPFGIEDADFLLRWNNDPDYAGKFELFEPVTRGELEEWLPRNKPDQLWYIIENTLGEKVGQIVGRYQKDGSVQIGYRVIPPARGRGYSTEAVATMIHHLFDQGIGRITAEANPRNTPSLRVLEKLGFYEIEYKKKAVELNGVWLDGVVYELRREI